LSPCHWPRLSATDGGCWGSPPAPLGRPRLEKSPAAVGPRRRGEKEEEEDEEEEGGGDGSQACPRQTEAAGAALWRISDARAWKNRQRQLGLGGGGRRRRRRRKGRRRWVAGLYATDGGARRSSPSPCPPSQGQKPCESRNTQGEHSPPVVLRASGSRKIASGSRGRGRRGAGAAGGGPRHRGPSNDYRRGRPQPGSRPQKDPAGGNASPPTACRRTTSSREGGEESPDLWRRDPCPT
ncbi:unnamed protein product, partial [Prorocentrum cordatum]